MPDAIYLYSTGNWRDTATRQERIGSIALDFVGKCFNDGEYDACCLIVKFATKPGQYDDAVKWYAYPNITSEDDIWSILSYELGQERSVGRGYHSTVHPFLQTTEYERISPPKLRIYNNNSYYSLEGELQKQTVEYRQVGNFTNLNIAQELYTLHRVAPGTYMFEPSYFFMARNAKEQILSTHSWAGTWMFLDKQKDVIASNWESANEWQPYLGRTLAAEVNTNGWVYNASIVYYGAFSIMRPSWIPYKDGVTNVKHQLNGNYLAAFST